MAIRNVLIVDDSKTELMFMTDLLQKKGFTVRTAENAEDAFRRLAEEKPDLILMMDREGDLSITAEDVQAHPALGLTPAAEKGRIVRMNGMLLLGFGPRTPEAATALYDALYQAEG